MPDDAAKTQRMEQLRAMRSRPEKDVTLGFLPKAFRQEVERPFKQLEGLTELWAELLPADLVEHTRLEGLQRGVLRVVVDSAGRHYELDRLLRGGVQRELITRHTRGALRSVKVRVGVVNDAPGDDQPDA